MVGVKKIAFQKRGGSRLHLHIDHEELTESYEKNEIILLVKDKTTLYTYWEVSIRRLTMIEDYFQCTWDRLPKLLRVYDVTLIDFNGDNANDHRTIEITNEANNWFIEGIHPNNNYCIDFGVKTIDHKFFSIMRSNVVKLYTGKEEKLIENISESPEWMEQFNGYSLSNRTEGRLI